VYTVNGKYYSVGSGLEMTDSSWNPVTIYEVVDYETLKQTKGYIDGRYYPGHANYKLLNKLSYWFGLNDTNDNPLIGESDFSGRESTFTKG
jgi:hypothetical protein